MPTTTRKQKIPVNWQHDADDELEDDSNEKGEEHEENQQAETKKESALGDSTSEESIQGERQAPNKNIPGYLRKQEQILRQCNEQRGSNINTDTNTTSTVAAWKKKNSNVEKPPKVTGTDRETCPDCGTTVIVNTGGTLRRHTCKNGAKSVGAGTENNKEQSKARGKRIADQKKTKELQQQRDDSEEDENSEPSQGSGVTKTRTARQRDHRQLQWDADHVELLRVLSEGDEDNEERTARLGDVLDHVPPGMHLAPITDNTDKSLDQAKKNITSAEEETVQGIPDMSLDRNSEIMSIMRIKHFLRDGNLTKARNVLHESGSFDYTTTAGSAKLKSKYPVDEKRRTTGADYLNSTEHEEHKRATTQGVLANDESVESLKQHINKKKRGSAYSSTGHSNDHYQRIIKNHPKAIVYLVQISDWIASGGVVDGPTQEKLTMGRGTALNKKFKMDVRPITTRQPLLNYAGHLLIKHHRNAIEVACGENQLGIVNAGLEANGHAHRHLIERDPMLTMMIMDVYNAYGSPYHDSLFRAVSDEVPEMKGFAEMEMSRGVSKTVYHNFKADVTQVEYTDRGVPQGGTASTAIFCVGLAAAVTRQLIEEFGDVCTVTCISDNITVTGPPNSNMDLFERAAIIAKPHGLIFKPEGSAIYGHGEYTAETFERAERLGIPFIPKESGLMCAGTPIGSDEYVTNEANKKADEIISELADITALATSPYNALANSGQSLYYMMRLTTVQQFIFMERVVKPSLTLYPAQRIDRALFNAISAVTNTTSLLPPQDSEDMELLLKATFMPISFGGNGFMSAEETAEGAYAASILQCAALLSKTCPALAKDAAQGKYTPSIFEAIQTIVQLKAADSKAVVDIDVTTMWTKSAKGMQRKINREKLQAKRSQYLLSIPAATPERGEDDDPDAFPRRVQMLANEDSAANAWMFANPGWPGNHMSNINFSVAYSIRSGLRSVGSRKNCVCSEAIDAWGEHSAACRLNTVRAAERSHLHSDLQYGTWRFLKDNLGSGDYGVENGEPHVTNYFDQKIPEGAECRSDICINNKVTNVDTLIDVTTTAAVAKGFRDSLRTKNDIYKPGKGSEFGEERKLKHYNKHFFMDQRAEDSKEAIMKTMCWETNGSISAETKAVIRDLATMVADAQAARDKGPPTKSSIDLNQRQFTQTTSVTIQNRRARALRAFIKRSTLDEPPTIPRGTRDGPIPRLDPPAYISLPHNRGRFHALPPLPSRCMDLRWRLPPRLNAFDHDSYPPLRQRTMNGDDGANAARQMLLRTTLGNSDND